MTDTPLPRSTCLAPGCGGQLVIPADGPPAWHHTGPHGAGLHRPIPADPTPTDDAVENAYCDGLEVGFRAALDAITADPDHAERALIRAAHAHGVELTIIPLPPADRS